MSKTIDEKVVEMRFDNKQFEDGVATSMSTLDKLKKSLNLDGAAKGLDGLSDAAKKCDMSTLSRSVEAVQTKFSAMQVVAMTALTNITNSAMNAGKQLLSSLTVEPITTGFNEYELKMGSIQTIMASTGESLDRVNQKLDELNKYSDRTIYSFSDMTSNIGKFTNAGVKLDDAVSAIQGVSNVAAVSGANAAEASRAMYNFAQALSAGYVKLIDWKSIENANMATVEFKTQLLESAVAAGTLTRTTDGMYKTIAKGTVIDATHLFNDSLQEQWMTTEVLTSTLKDYADETTEIGKKAFAAAQDVKTWTQLLDTLKESAQSGWAETWQLVAGDYEEAKATLRTFSEFFSGIIDGSSEARKLVLEDCAAGSLTMTLPPANKAYSTISRLTTDIRVDKDGKELWFGRVLSESKDFWNNRVLVCEGELAFFNDSSQPPKEYAGQSIRYFMEQLIAIHNSKVPANRRFTIGAVTVEDNDYPTRYTNYEKTIEHFNALVEQYGGHLRVRHQDGVRYLDYLKDYPDTASQLIQFGSNLIEFTRNWDSTEFASVIIPLGDRLDDSPIEALDAYLTIESVNQGSMYLQSDEAVKSFGWIEKVVTWDNVSDPDVLLRKAKTYLTDIQFDNMELEISALDLHYMSVEYEAIKLLDEIRVISRPHGLDRLFPVTKLEIPLDSPEKTQFTLGSSVKSSLTSVNNQISAAILQKIEALPKKHSLLKEAKENATQIMNMATTGYITITKDDYGSETLYISNTRDYTAASKLWKWNMNGLGYSNDGGKTFGLAITMDGSIVADYITTGVLNADVIRAGVLKDYGGNFSLDFETGKLTMKKGSIDIGNGNFTVDEEGNLYARRGTFAGTLSGAKGTFGGQLTAATGSFKGVVQAEDFVDKYGNSMMNGTKFKSDYLDLYGITITNPYTREVTFKVDGSTGAVTINGKVTMGAGSSINWAQVSEQNVAYNSAYSLASTANSNAMSAWYAADDAAYDASQAWARATTAYQNMCTDQKVFDILTSGGTKFGIQKLYRMVMELYQQKGESR